MPACDGHNVPQGQDAAGHARRQMSLTTEHRATSTLLVLALQVLCTIGIGSADQASSGIGSNAGASSDNVRVGTPGTLATAACPMVPTCAAGKDERLLALCFLVSNCQKNKCGATAQSRKASTKQRATQQTVLRSLGLNTGHENSTCNCVGPYKLARNICMCRLLH